MNLTREQASAMVGVAETGGVDIELASALFDVLHYDDVDNPDQVRRELVHGYAATFRVSQSDSGSITKTIQSLTDFLPFAAANGIDLLDPS
jgi:succinyl-CoA synthetase beta subunit